MISKEENRVGVRVRFLPYPNKCGTIIGFAIGDYSVFVKWDDGKEDWYRRSDLKCVEQCDIVEGVDSFVIKEQHEVQT